MSALAVVSEDERTLTVRVPLAHQKRGGRKLVVAPDGGEWAPAPPRVDNALLKALARAHRWRRMLESGRFATIKELAAAEKINASFVSRVLRLTLLAPHIVQAILDGSQPEWMTPPRLMERVEVEWERQCGHGQGTTFRSIPVASRVQV